MVGQFAIGLAIVTPIITFSNLQLRTFLATDASREMQFGHYLALRLVATALALVAIAGVAVLADYRSEVVWVILLVALSRAIESISDMFHGYCQQHERLDWVAISYITREPISLLLVGIGIAVSGSLLVGLIGFTLARVVTLLSVDIWNAVRLLSPTGSVFGCLATWRQLAWRTLLPAWEHRVVASIAWRTLPLGITVMLSSLSVSIPRFFVEAQLGERALGVFAALASFIVAGMTGVFALLQAAVPRLAQYYTDRNELAFCRLQRKLVVLSAAIGLSGVLVSVVGGHAILSTFYSPEYAQHTGLLVGLMVAGMFLFVATCYECVATARRRIRYQPAANLITIVVTLAASWLLIGSHGLWGAVATTIVAAVIRVIAYRMLLPLRGCSA